MLRWIFLSLGLLAVPIEGQRDFDLEYVEGIEPLSYVAYRTAGALQIDGKLDEPSWQRAAWTAAFVDIEGQRKPLPAFKTRVKMLWDDEYLYLAADLEEPHVWATYTERDATIYHENDFEVFIDPDGDTHQYYEFEINALGTEWDLLLVKPYRDGGPYMSAWDINGLQTAVTVWGSVNNPLDEDQGWSVEMALPWAVLKEATRDKVPPLDGDQWRINFSRVQWAVEYDSGSYIKVEGKGPICTFQKNGVMCSSPRPSWADKKSLISPRRRARPSGFYAGYTIVNADFIRNTGITRRVSTRWV